MNKSNNKSAQKKKQAPVEANAPAWNKKIAGRWKIDSSSYKSRPRKTSSSLPCWNPKHNVNDNNPKIKLDLTRSFKLPSPKFKKTNPPKNVFGQEKKWKIKENALGKKSRGRSFPSDYWL